MSDQWTVAIRDEFGRVLCVEPNGQGVVEFREAAGAWETVTLTKHGPNQYSALFREAKRFLCVTDTGALETREQRGAWETFRVTEQPPDWQPIFLFRDGAFRALTVDVL